MSFITPYESAEPHQPAPSWRSVHRFWIELMCVYARDCERANVDALDPNDLRYERGYVSHFMHDLIRARSSAERERIISEAATFLDEREQRARLATTPRMKTVDEVRLDRIEAPRPPLKALRA